MVIPGINLAAVVINGVRPRRNLDRDGLRERCVADQTSDSWRGCDGGDRRGDQQFLHGGNLPWNQLPVVKPGPRLGPPLASWPSTWQAAALSTLQARART